MDEKQQGIGADSYNINQYDIKITNELLDCRVFWARVVNHERDSLLTQYTKHTFYEVQYALEGKIDLLLGEDTHLELAQSDFTVIPPNTYHQIVDGDSVGARFIMAFSAEVKEASILPVMERLGTPYACHDTANMRMLLSMILAKGDGDEPMRRRGVTSLLESFLWEMLETVGPSSTAAVPERVRTSEYERRVSEIEAFIHAYHGIGLRVSDIARRFGVGERHLNRMFHVVRGESVRDVINREKLRKMEELIASTALSLQEISALCGFSDEYAMNKFFRRYNLTGLSNFRKVAKTKGTAHER